MNKKIAAVLLLGFYGQQVDASQSKNALVIETSGISGDGQPLSVGSLGQGTWRSNSSVSAPQSGSLSPNALNLSSGLRSRSKSAETIEDINDLSSQSIRSSRFMNCSDLTIIKGPTTQQKKITKSTMHSQADQSLNCAVSAQENEKMKSGKNEANTFWADTGLLVGWPVVGAIASAACPPLIVPCMATAALQDTFSVRRKKIHTNTDSGWSNVGHTLLSLRIFAPILAYAGMMYVAPEKTSDTFKQVAGPALVGLTLAVGAENIYQARKFHHEAVRCSGSCNGESYSDDKSRARGRQWKAEHPTWANDETLKKYNALRHGSVAGFIYGLKPEFVKNPDTGGSQV